MTELNKFLLSALPSPLDVRDWQAESIFPEDLDLPEEFSLKGKMCPVRNQGAEGSCIAETCSAIKEFQERENVGFMDYMSPQFVYNLRQNQDGEGMYPRNAMSILRSVGIVPEDMYPYGVIQKPDQISTSLAATANNYRISGYAFINTIQGLKTAIHRCGPTMITVPVYNTGPRMWKQESPTQVIQGGHSMTAVGWTKDGFIIRNSWGSSWGDNGYTVFPYSDWGMQGEVVTAIDDQSSKPDPKYSKWYWRFYKWIQRVIKNAPYLVFWLVLSLAATIYGFISDLVLVGIGSGILACIVAVVIKNKLYAPRDVAQ